MAVVRAFCILLALLSTPLNGEIIETNNFRELLSYVTADSLVVFDVDNTLIEPNQELGTVQWLRHRIQEQQSCRNDKQEGLEKALAEWAAIQFMTKVHLVQEGIDDVIQEIQDQGVAAIAVTSRGLGLASRTIDQLKSVNIDLSKTAPSDEEHFFKTTRGVLFRGGVLFTAGTHKALAVSRLFGKIGYFPKHVVYINDNSLTLMLVESLCEQSHIPFVGIRYGFLDAKVKNFRKQIADVQFYHFSNILTDEAAERILSGS